MQLHGGCICTNVRYTINQEPLFVHACHCSDCQRYSGSAFVVLVGTAKDDFEVDGELTKVTNPTPSGSGYDANLCPKCATVIWQKYHFVDLPIIVVRGGTLDDPALAPPTYHIFTDSKQPWLELSDSEKTFPGWMEANEVWSPKTLQRMKEMADVKKA